MGVTASLLRLKNSYVHPLVLYNEHNVSLILPTKNGPQAGHSFRIVIHRIFENLNQLYMIS